MIAPRTRFQGTVQILKFNWTFYVQGLAAIAVGITVLKLIKLPHMLVVAGVMGIGVAAWWWLASILVSWWVYDFSPLMKWDWVKTVTEVPAPLWVNLHSGLDESTPGLTRIWGPPQDVFDFFHPAEMTEPSIIRARSGVRNQVPAIPVDFRVLPFRDGTLDLISVIFSAHEIRNLSNREKFFGELERGLKSGGRLLVVEHQRDFANFLAFGPGFFHFFPTSSWKGLGESAGLQAVSMTRLTPFVMAFIWTKK